MSLFVETTDYRALPADIKTAIENPDGGYQVPHHVSLDFGHYQFIPCDRCQKPVTEHVWIAVDRNESSTRVLRCSNSETA